MIPSGTIFSVDRPYQVKAEHKHGRAEKACVSQILMMAVFYSLIPISVFRLVAVRLFTCLMFSLLGLRVLTKDYKTFLRVVIY